MTALIAILIVLASVAAMEWVAWASHKYIMHGWGWAWHRDHHEPHDNLLEKNDLYGIVGAAMSISMFMLGSEWVLGDAAWWPATFIGIGILLYGIIYTLVHDGLVHQRYFRYVPKSGYAKRLVQAHKLHLCAVGRQLVLQIEGRERGSDIHIGHFARGLILNRCDHQRDDPFGDRGIAVSQKMQSIAIFGGIDPHAGRTAAHEGRIGFERIGHIVQLAAKLD